MKLKKYLTVGLLFIGMTTIVGCMKEDMSKYVTQDQLNNYATNNDLDNKLAKVFNFNLTFMPGDTYTTYDGITGFKKGDVILTYILYANYGDINNPDPFWVLMPFIHDNGAKFFAEYSDEDGFLFVNAEKSNGSSPFTSVWKNGFKAVLIKANGLIKHPDIDYNNYQEVAKAFNLE